MSKQARTAKMNPIIVLSIFVIMLIQFQTGALDPSVRRTRPITTAHYRCKLVYGIGSKICQQMEIDGNVQKTVGSILESTFAASGRHLPVLDGRWGKWGRYDKCSRTCGGGIKKKFRECDSPTPLNGGKNCTGERVKYRSCGIKACPADSRDFREDQCARFNSVTFGIQGLSSDVKWHAKYIKVATDDRCKLYCQLENKVYFMLLDKVIDGTPCGLDSSDICVNGHCMQAGCDHVLNSTVKLDMCGICRGDNSTCQRISGTYNSSVYGYTRIVKIPVGSSSIYIRQYGWEGSRDDNYLALRLGEDGEYILNGNYIVMDGKVPVLSGTGIEYSGPGSIVERINIPRPINTDLILEVLSVGDVVPPQIVYEYRVPKKILNHYTWILSDWSSCSHTCQGIRRRHAECRSIEGKAIVPDDHCLYEDRPEEEIQLCNRRCILGFHHTHYSPRDIHVNELYSIKE